jgi:hypothetical protein
MTMVDVDVLREVTNRIFDFMQRDLELRVVDLPENFYTDVAEDNRYEMGNQPKELEFGSLADDMAFVKAAYKDPSQAIPETLLHIAPLLRALATSVPNYKPPTKET